MRIPRTDDLLCLAPEWVPEKQKFGAPRRMRYVFFDDGGSIGRRYRRQDEAGTPFAITVDGQSVQDGTVTVRHRDTLVQDRVGADAVAAWLAERVAP